MTMMTGIEVDVLTVALFKLRKHFDVSVFCVFCVVKGETEIDTRGDF